MTRYPATESDRERPLGAARARGEIQGAGLNLSLAEVAEVIDDLHKQVANDLRRKQWQRP
jgi:hypothetical protein